MKNICILDTKNALNNWVNVLNTWGDLKSYYVYYLLYHGDPGPEIIKLLSCSTQLSMKF